MQLEKMGGSRKVAAFLIVCVLLFGRVPGTAATQPALLMTIHGDLWAWSDGKLQQRTAWGYNRSGVLSPNGSQIAYKAIASLAVDAIKRVGPISGGDLPANIWVL